MAWGVPASGSAAKGGVTGPYARWARWRSVMLVMAAHELERLQIWINPTVDPTRRIGGGEVSSSTISAVVAKLTPDRARQLLQDAWDIDPALALR